MGLLGSHILSTDQFDRELLEQVFSVARRMEPIAGRRLKCRALEGALLANLFFEPSTRSRVSFGAAFSRLGGKVLDTTGIQASSIAKGESLYDTGRVISGYVDAIVARHPQLGAVRELSEGAQVPVINSGDGPGEHPTQAILDTYTMHKEFAQSGRGLDGLHIAIVGDLKYGRTVNSLVRLLSNFRSITFRLVSAPELRASESLVDHARSRGHSVVQSDDLQASLPDIDLLYVTRIQTERFASAEEAARMRGRYSVNRKLYEKYCRPGTLIMHPLPRDSQDGGCELSTDLDQTSALAIFRQTDNGIPVRMALFAMLLGVDERIEAHCEPVKWGAFSAGANGAPKESLQR